MIQFIVWERITVTCDDSHHKTDFIEFKRRWLVQIVIIGLCSILLKIAQCCFYCCNSTVGSLTGANFDGSVGCPQFFFMNPGNLG